MKRVLLGVAATTAAVSAAVLVPQVAGATGGRPTTEVSVDDKADYDFAGTNLDLGLQVKCSSAVGEAAVTASVTQQPPETPYPVTLSSGTTLAVCDGRWHSVAVTVVGAGFDAGKATATVTVVPVAGSPMRTTTEYVTIVAV